MRKSEMKAQINHEMRVEFTRHFVELYGVTMFEKATEGGRQNNGAVGKAFETYFQMFGASRLIGANANEKDGVGYIRDCPREYKKQGFLSVLEFKTGGADISKHFQQWLDNDLKIDFVVYWLRKPYGKDPSPCLPIIVTADNFFSAVAKCCLRKDKKNYSDKHDDDADYIASRPKRGKKKPYCIEPNYKPWLIWCEQQTIFSPIHRYTFQEILSHDANLTQADYDAIYTFFDILNV